MRLLHFGLALALVPLVGTGLMTWHGRWPATCHNQAQGFHDIVRVMNAQGTGLWPPLVGHGYEEECLVLDTGTFARIMPDVQGKRRYRYQAPSLLPSSDTDMFGQTPCWSGTEFIDPDMEIETLLWRRDQRQRACASQGDQSHTTATSALR